MSNNPESQPYDYDEVTRLRLQLNQTELQRDAYQKALSVEVLKVVRVSIIQATINADEEISRLKAEVERLTAFTTRTIIPNDELQAQVDELKAENARMSKDEAYYEMRHKELLSERLRLGHQVRELADKLRKAE
jgi:hypothetical protein